MKIIKFIFYTVVVFFIARAIFSGGKSHESEVNACIARGVEYFQAIGSFPTLKSEPNVGRHAADVAEERCERTTTAF